MKQLLLLLCLLAPAPKPRVELELEVKRVYKTRTWLELTLRDDTERSVPGADVWLDPSWDDKFPPGRRVKLVLTPEEP